MPDPKKTSVGRRHGQAKWLLKAIPAARAQPVGAPPAGFTLHALAPGEWLMVGEGEPGADVPPPGYDTASGRLTVDLSSAYAVVRISGPRARDVVAKGAAIDLHDSAFATATSSVCRFGPFRVLLHRAAPDAYDLFLSRSLVGPCVELIAEYGAEFGIEHEEGNET